MAENVASPAPADSGARTLSRGKRFPVPGVSTDRVEGPPGPCVPARAAHIHGARRHPTSRFAATPPSPPSDRPQTGNTAHRAVRPGREGRFTMNARRCAVALILGAAMAAAAAAGADEILDLGDGRVYRGEVLDGRPHREGGVYADEYRDGERSGHSRFTWPNGASYRQGTSRTRLSAASPGSAGSVYLRQTIKPPIARMDNRGPPANCGRDARAPRGACQEFGSAAEMLAPQGFWPSPTPRRCG